MAYKGTGGVYHMSLPTIASVVQKKIGEKINTSMYNVQFIGLQPDNSGWFYHDGLRSGYADYREYIDNVYTPNDVPITEFTTFSTPFKTLDSAFGDVRPDTTMATIGRTAAKDTLYRTYSAKQLHDKVYSGKGITRGLNATLGLVGHLNGFSVYIDPYTGRAGDLEYMSSTYANYTNDIGGAPDTEDLNGYFSIDNGFNQHYFITPTELAQGSVDALRSNLFTGENILASARGGIGNKYVNVKEEGKDYSYRGGDYSNSSSAGTTRLLSKNGDDSSSGQQTTTGVFYRESDANSTTTDGSNQESEQSGEEKLLGTYVASRGFNLNDTNGSDLLARTNEAFANNKYKTMISRFCIDVDDDDNEIQSAKSVYGISHGRNLLKKTETYNNGYLNPYCRVWTNHHEYSTYGRLIRPFNEDEDGFTTQASTGKSKGWDLFRSTSGSTLLDEYSVLDFNTNTIRFSPTSNNDGEYNKDVKRCMFSIENLAWKGQTKYLLEEQKGPFGGRIMWFPPYGLTFNENTNVDWASHSFIGRGEKIYTYVDSERRGNLDFNIIIDHPAIANEYGNDANISENDLLRFYAGCDIPDLSGVNNNTETYRLEKKEVGKTNNPNYKKIKFAVFFPNNYSGEEDGDLANNSDYPIMYLLNGVGTGEYYDIETNELKTIPCTYGENENWFREYDIVTEATIKQGNEDVTVKIQDESKVKTGFVFDGGYEMGQSSDVGISLCTDSLPVRFPYKDWKQANVVIDGDAKDLQYSYNICRKTVSGSTNEDVYILSGINTYKNRPNDGLWFYRVDKTYRKNKFGELLDITKNYADLKSHGLNSKIGVDIVKETFPDTNTTYVSLADIAKAIMTKQTSGMSDKYFDQDKVDTLKGMLDANNIAKIEICGYASSQGYSEKNEDGLAKRRAQTVKKWLKERLGSKLDSTGTEIKIESFKEQPDRKKNDNQSRIIKLDKCAVVTISLQPKEENNDESTSLSLQESLITVGNGYKYTTYESLKQAADAQGFTIIPIRKNTVDETVSLKGYGNEYKFFKKLEKNSPLIFNRLKEKIQYFEPAYHSISPEGYVERLNFLNQCTRQGATNTGNGGAANNLAFGRAPVCVLRIGDFFYTKILITSISIDYSETTWDMNPEGAGLQPMYAKVSIQFIFQGGSDISGPVSRLQDAMSFNYYANMGVTSDYAERMKRDENGNVIGIQASPINRKQ